MSLLHPYLLGGLALIGVPILIHLITRQKPKHLRFPAFRFLVQKFQVNRRKLRLHHLLLLLLRMLLILLLCLALARPLLRADKLPFLPNRSQPVAAVLLFDTSMSMEYERGELSRLDDAKRRALELLEEMPDGSRVAVLDSADGGGEFLDRHAALRDRIKGLELRPANDPVTKRFDRAFALLADVAKESEAEGVDPPPRYLYVFSDRTRACWDPADVRSLKPQEGVSTAFVDVGVEEPIDLAVESVEVEPATAPAGSPIQVRAVIRATGKRADRKVICQIDGAEGVQEKQANVGENELKTIVFDYRAAPADGPGRGGDLAPGPHSVVVRLEGSDRMPFNDARYATFLVHPGRRVLTLMDDPDRDTRTGAREPWKVVLSLLFSAEFRAPDAGINFKDYDLVCLFDVANPDKELWDKLRDYVNDGGKLAVVPAGDGSQQAYNTKAAQELLPGPLTGPVTAPGEGGVPWNFDPGNRAPLMAPFLKWKREIDNVDFLKRQPIVLRYWKVTPKPRAAVVARYSDAGGGDKGSPALLELDVGQGKVVLFTTRLDSRTEKIFGKPRQWQNYWTSSFGLVLVDKVCRYLAGDSVATDWNFVCGESVTLPLPARGDYSGFKLYGPGLPVQGMSLNAPTGRSLPISRAEQAGNYRVDAVRNNRTEVLGRFSVNVRAAENRLLPRVEVKEIEEVLGPDSVLTPKHGLSLSDALAGKRQPTPLMPALMLGLLIFLAVENLLANKFYRRRAGEK